MAAYKDAISKKQHITKFLEINLKRYMKSFYGESCKILLRVIKEDINKWKTLDGTLLQIIS